MAEAQFSLDREGRPIQQDVPGCTFGAVLKASLVEKLDRQESNVGGLRVQINHLEDNIKTLFGSFLKQTNDIREKVSANAVMLANALSEFGSTKKSYHECIERQEQELEDRKADLAKMELNHADEMRRRDLAQANRDKKLDLVVAYVEQRILVRKMLTNVGKAVAAVIAVAGTIAGIVVTVVTLVKHFAHG
jgi:hypothetical protein